MARVFVVEDDRGFREQLAELLRGAGHDVSCATRFGHLAEDARTASPDLVVLDLGLPGTDGLLELRGLRQSVGTPVLVLTSRETETDELSSLALGADDFVPKSANPQLILAHVDALLRRTGTAAPQALAWGDLTLDLARAEAARGGRAVELTRNELRILDMLVRARGAIVPREDLMEALWATDCFVDDNTLTVNVNRLRQTLGRIGARDLVVTHRGQGYSLRAPGDATDAGDADAPAGNAADGGAATPGGKRGTS